MTKPCIGTAEYRAVERVPVEASENAESYTEKREQRE